MGVVIADLILFLFSASLSAIASSPLPSSPCHLVSRGGCVVVGNLLTAFYLSSRGCLVVYGRYLFGKP